MAYRPKLRRFGRNWRSLSGRRASPNQVRQIHKLPTNGSDSWAPNSLKKTICYRALSSAKQGLDSVEQESVTSDRDNGGGMAERVDSEEGTNSDCLFITEETERDNELFMPFKSSEDPAAYQKGTFQYLFENSLFVKAMDPVGKEVEAEVLAVVEDKLYVDFGCKFHAVVSCPDTVKESVQRGTKVIIAVKDLEVTQAFIGGSKHDSLLEATAEFVRLQV